VLEEFAAVLNRNIPEFRRVHDPEGFRIVDGRPVAFFVFNLADTANAYPKNAFDSTAYSDGNPFTLNSRGVYHFAPLRLNLSFSHIGVLAKGRLKVFSFLNCEGKGDSLPDVVEYVTEMGFDNTVVARVRNYRAYGTYFQVDPQSYVMCK